MYLVWQARGRKTNFDLPPRWGLLFGCAYLAGLSHILLDFTNNYGVRPFWPFSGRWYSWDIVFIIEPALLLLLIGGLVLPSLFFLINEEIGSRARGPKGKLGARLALIGVLLVWGVRDYEHRRAVAAMDARLYEGADPIRVSAFPNMLNPFRWNGVVETEDFFATMPVDSLTPEVDPRGDMRIRPKPEETDITLAAKKSYLGRVFLDWAQYPITETEQVTSPQPGYVVRFRDLRFEYPGPPRRNPLSAGVQLDSNLRVVREFMGSRSKDVSPRSLN